LQVVWASAAGGMGNRALSSRLVNGVESIRFDDRPRPRPRPGQEVGTEVWGLCAGSRKENRLFLSSDVTRDQFCAA
jgi:hypothetical protein